MGKRINTIMQTCFFAITDVLECGQAIAAIKDAINRTYSHKSEKVLQSNFAAVDQALAHLEEVTVPDQATAGHDRPPTVPEQAPDFVKRVTAMMLSGKGD